MTEIFRKGIDKRLRKENNMETIRRVAPDTIGGRIRERREEAGLTQAELAKEVGVLRATINQWENETRDIKTTFTVKLANYFGVTCDYILRGIVSENVSIHDATGLSNGAIERIKNLQQYTRDGLNTLLESQYSINILSAIYSATKISNYSGEELFRFNNIRTKHINRAIAEALEQEDLVRVANSVSILQELEYSPKQQSAFLAQKYLTLLLEEVSDRKEEK